jgi:hypothetical protein
LETTTPYNLNIKLSKFFWLHVKDVHLFLLFDAKTIG